MPEVSRETRYFHTQLVCQRYGRHRTWLWRQLQRDFPPPDLKIAGQSYWREATLDAWDASQAKGGGAS